MGAGRARGTLRGMSDERRSKVQAGLAGAARWLGRAGLGAGRSAAAAWNAVDPDVRRHVAHLPLAGLSYLAAADEPLAALPDDGHRPLLFVHGLGGHRGNFGLLRGLLGLSGRSRSWALGLGDRPLPEMAAAVQGAIAQLVQLCGLPEGGQLDVVAHSMGGLVARLALLDPSTSARVGTLVTLGTPHGGTQAARFGATAHVLQLRPDSETIQRLAAQLPWRGPPTQPRLVCLWSESDVLLLPSSTARVEGAESVELHGFTHYSYLIHPRAAAAVLAALR